MLQMSRQVSPPAQQTRADLGPLDVLLNHAGIGLFKYVYEYSAEKDLLDAVNIKGNVLPDNRNLEADDAAIWWKIIKMASVLNRGV
ncbi:MAG: hypothetical protein D6791_16060 [Chloroflexi bacterium]|nr:MAG: hypothetical protein D6791_16060 [Chloroflexota bacterium]